MSIGSNFTGYSKNILLNQGTDMKCSLLLSITSLFSIIETPKLQQSIFNDMSLSKISKSENCRHNYCPHLHFNRCQIERERNIPYTHRPMNEINLNCNIHPKVLKKLTTINMPTIAYERYTEHPVLPDQEETNFSKNFYLQNCPDNFQLRNTLLKDLEDDLAPFNAYSLAAGATEDYNIFAKQREEHLHNARKRADHAYHQFKHKQQMIKTSLKEEQTKWVTNYFRKIEELIDHIFCRTKNQNDQNEDPNIKDKLFLKEQAQNNVKKLSSLKVSQPQTALAILQSMRAVLLRKKAEFQEERNDQDHNKTLEASCVDASSVSNTSQNQSAVSFVSGTTAATKQEGEAKFAEKYCDFDALKKKWGKSSVEEVRNLLRRMICGNLIIRAEGHQMREKKRAKVKDEFLKKEMLRMGLKKGQTKEGKKGKAKKQQKSAIHAHETDEKPVPFFKDSLTKQQQIVKTTLMRGGIFDSVGDAYQRNRNYSKLFRKRGEQSLCQLSFKENSPPKYSETSRIGLR